MLVPHSEAGSEEPLGRGQLNLAGNFGKFTLSKASLATLCNMCSFIASQSVLY